MFIYSASHFSALLMHESVNLRNTIIVIYLLEISGANKLSLFDVKFFEPPMDRKYFTTKKRDAVNFPRLPHLNWRY